MIKNKTQRAITEKWVNTFLKSLDEAPDINDLPEDQQMLAAKAREGVWGQIQIMQAEMEEYDIRVANHYMDWIMIEGAEIGKFYLEVVDEEAGDYPDDHYLEIVSQNYDKDNIQIRVCQLAPLPGWKSPNEDMLHNTLINGVQEAEDLVANLRKLV